MVMFSGPDCGPGTCECDTPTEAYYRCVSLLPDGSRCGLVSGPFPGLWEYMAQGRGHYVRFDDPDALHVLDGREHGHDGPNYHVPVTGNG